MFRLLLLLLLIPVPLMALDESGVEVFDYGSRWGAVRFQHLEHQKRVGDCRVCHHQGVEFGGCGNCHGVINKLPQFKDVLHKTCSACHWEKRGPTECSGCHDPERLDESVYKD